MVKHYIEGPLQGKRSTHLLTSRSGRKHRVTHFLCRTTEGKSDGNRYLFSKANLIIIPKSKAALFADKSAGIKLGAKAIGRRELENNQGYELKEPQRVGS